MNNHAQMWYNQEGDYMDIKFHSPFGSYSKEEEFFTGIYDDVTHYLTGLYIPKIEGFDWRILRGRLNESDYKYAINAIIQTNKRRFAPK